MSEFDWPPLYNFPPFFTLQPNLSTRQKQIETWASLVLAYYQQNKIFILDVVEAQQSPLFNNSKISRKLTTEGIGIVLEYLDNRGHIEWLDKRKKRCRINWRTTEQWAKLIYDWAVGNGLLNSVCTLYELTSGEDTSDEAFHGLDRDVLVKALRHLESEKKAQLLSPKDVVEEGDTVVVYINYNQSTVVVVECGKTLQTKYGALRHDYLMGKSYGTRINCTKGYVYVLCPSPELWSQNLEHRTQILYTSDVSLVTFNLDLKPGSVVGEAGTGSGSLSHALIRTIAPTGHLYTYEVNKERYEAVNEEFNRHGLSGLVTSTLRDVCHDGFGEEVMGLLDAIFLDLPQPWQALESAKRALKPNGVGRFCSFSPCMEQVQKMCEELRGEGFVDVDVVECVSRSYKVLAIDRVTGQARGPTKPGQDQREWKEENDVTLVHAPFPFEQPTHTGYLTFATLSPQTE